jgi:beta-glucosidase
MGHHPGVDIDSEDESGIAPACELARAAGLVILCLGEDGNMSGEGASRGRPGLPGRQAQLAESIIDLGRPVIVLLTSGRPLVVASLFARADAVLATWALGTEAGHAIADVLTGRYNPSGRLPVSWPLDVGQIPVFYAQRPTGRPPDPANRYSSRYIDLPVEPLFPFGHGLAYTRFSFLAARTDRDELRPEETLTIEVDVRNDGPRAGRTAVLLFVRDLVASVARPLLELKGMGEIVLAPAETGTVRLRLAAADLAFPGADLSPVLESGTIRLFVGPSADPLALLAKDIRIVGGAPARP